MSFGVPVFLAVEILMRDPRLTSPRIPMHNSDAGWWMQDNACGHSACCEVDDKMSDALQDCEPH